MAKLDAAEFLYDKKPDFICKLQYYSGSLEVWQVHRGASKAGVFKRFKKYFDRSISGSGGRWIYLFPCGVFFQ